MATQFKSDGDAVPVRRAARLDPGFGVHYAVGVDGIALVLIAMAAVLVPDRHPRRPGTRPTHGERSRSRPSSRCMLLLETMMIGVFAATDVFLFYVFFEAMLIPMYFMIGSYGGAQRSYAAVKFLLYSLFGGLLMLAALIALYVVSRDQLGTGTSTTSSCIGLHLNPTTRSGCSSASSSPSRSRRRCGRSTPGCPTPPPSRRPGPRCCWSACSTRSARSA